MKIVIKKPLALNETGGRSNNEDSVYPPKGTALTDQRLFMVCDGVGGSEKGEVASALAIQSISGFFKQTPVGIEDRHVIDQAVEFTQKRFKEVAEVLPETRGMATTMTLLYLDSGGALLAHIGDSRIYHIREGRILFQTEDHSLVNSLIKNNIISPEEALTHPQRNVITRAIRGNSDLKVTADVARITEIRPGDYFFLCSDGILESVGNDLLCSVFSKTGDNEEKVMEIYNQCSGHSRDNFSAYLIQVEDVTGQSWLSRIIKTVM